MCVLAVEMLDGSPHAATLHFATSPDAKQFYFLTSPDYRKAEPLRGRPASRASMVIGVEEANMKTLQMDGMVSCLPEEGKSDFDTMYFAKFPEKVGKFTNDMACMFVPTWWRFTDYTTPEGKRIISSTH